MRLQPRSERLDDLRRQLDQYDATIGALTEARYECWKEFAAEQFRLDDSTPRTRNRYVSPLGDRRETAVPCVMCRRPTAALDACCDKCYDRQQTA